MPQGGFLVYGQDNVSVKWDISDSFSDGVGLMGVFRVFWDLGGKPDLWLTGAVADKEPSFARWSILGTVEALGLLAARPRDRMGLAGWYTEWNGNYRDELRLLGVSPRNVFGFELYYNVAINRWLHLTVDLQLAKNLDKGDDIAVIPGGRLVLNF
jgi:hypothetical protein